MLSASEYRIHMDALAAVLRNVQFVPVEALRDHLEVSMALAPVIDPTAYRDGGSRRLEDQQDLLEAARAVDLALRKIAKRNGIQYPEAASDPGMS